MQNTDKSGGFQFMAIAELIFEILVLLLGLILIVSVILQKSKSEGITGVTATSESDNYFGKNKGLAGEEKLARITKVSTILFVIASIILTILFSVEAVGADTQTTAEVIATLISEMYRKTKQRRVFVIQKCGFFYVI